MFKAQLGVRINSPLNGYLNIDFAAQPNEQDRVLGNPYDIDNLVDANEADELLCSDSLDYLPAQGRSKALSHWLTRVAHGGIIVVQGNDIYEIARLTHIGHIDINQANQLIYGIGRKSCGVAQEVMQTIMSTGQFDIEKAEYDQNRPIYTVVARRK